MKEEMARLAIEFVKAKKQKLGRLARLYFTLHKNYVEEIMLKNQPEVLNDLVQKHAEGSSDLPSELDAIMLEEATELIKNNFDNKNGAITLYNILARAKASNLGHDDTNLLALTGIDQEIKLKDMRRTWQFTRTSSMIFKLIETFFYMIISNTQNLIYLSMMISMYVNAGLISIIYPLSIFGYALLEETRPRNSFWKFIRLYTTGLVLLKFIFNLGAFAYLLKSESY